jgi:DNA polymerase-1
MKILESSTLDVSTLSSDEQYWCYNALDCMITFEVFEALDPLPGGFGYDMSRTMQAPAFTLMTRGIKVDMHNRANVLQSLYHQRNRCESIFSRLCGEGLAANINYRSPKQLQVLFFELLGLEPVRVYNKLTKEYTVSTSREVIERLLKQPVAKPFCELLLSMRDFDKKIQVLESGLRNGRMHCSYQVAGPMTGRWSSNEDIYGDGTNLQNISDEMRRAFVPDTGLKFAQFDLAQAESKLVAYLASPFTNEQSYLQACLSGDLHTTVTKLVWKDLPWDKEPDKDIAKRLFYRSFSYRDMAKRGGHGSNYGGSSAVIGMHLKIPGAQAQAFQTAYFKAFPELLKWHNSVRIALATTRKIVTPLGRVCHFPGRPWDNDTIKSAIAYAPQSSIGDILNLGFFKVWKKYDKINDPAGPLEIITQVHDSILIQYRAEDESWLLPLVAKELSVPVTINGQVRVIAVDTQCGWNWGKYSNANLWGLKDYVGKDERQPPKALSFLDRRVG